MFNWYEQGEVVEFSEDDRRLLYVLYRGLIELRQLASSRGDAQLADLADALEFIPSEVAKPTADRLHVVQEALETYDRVHGLGRLGLGLTSHLRGPLPPPFDQSGSR